MIIPLTHSHTHSRSVWMKFMMGTSTCHSVWASHNDDNFVAVECTTLIKCVCMGKNTERNQQPNTKQGNKTNNNMRDSCQSLLLPSLSLSSPPSEICDWFDYTRHNYSFSFVTRNDFWPRGKKTHDYPIHAHVHSWWQITYEFVITQTRNAMTHTYVLRSYIFPFFLLSSTCN